MVKFARGNNALSEIWELEANSVEGQSLLQKDKKRGTVKGKAKKKKRKSLNVMICVCPRKNVIKRRAALAHFQP